jgi:hypothetical protein
MTYIATMKAVANISNMYRTVPSSLRSVSRDTDRIVQEESSTDNDRVEEIGETDDGGPWMLTGCQALDDYLFLSATENF